MKDKIITTLKILFSFWKTSIAIDMEYRLNFFVEIVSVIGNLSGSIFVLSLLFGPNTTLGGWSWNDSLIILGLYTILDGFTTSILQPNLSRIVRHVQNGTLDFVLLKPFKSQLWLSLRVISPWGIPAVISGFILIAYSLAVNSRMIQSEMILLGSLMLLSSLIILYSLWFLLSTLSIWFVKVWNTTEVLRSTLVAGRYPVSAYPNFLRIIFTFVLPIAFLTTVPAEAILGGVSNVYFIGSLVFSIFLFTSSILFWRFALRYYTSASS